MAFVIADRIKETTTSTGTGTITLAGEVSGYQTFVAGVGTGNGTYYVIAHQSADEWEGGIGTATDASPDTLSRDSFLSSSTGAAVSFSAGTKNVFCGLPAGRTVHGSNSHVGVLDPSSLSPVVNLDPDTISGNDGDAISSVASGGTAATFTQGTSNNRPILKTSSNGLDGHSIIRFVSTDSLVAATGGAALATDWTVIEVRKYTTIAGYQNGVSWGDSSGNGERRSPNFKFSTLENPDHSMAFVGEFADVDSDDELSVDIWYVLETTYDSGTSTIKLYIDGSEVGSGSPTPNALAAYTSTSINMGVNPGGSEGFIGDHAYLIMLDSVITLDQRTGIYAWLKERFPSLGIAGHVNPIPQYVGGENELAKSEMYQDADGNITVGGTTTLTTTNTQSSVTHDAVLPVHGQVCAAGSDHEHELNNSWAGQNTVSVWNKNIGGFSAVRFRRTGMTGEEVSAIGYGRDIEPWRAATQGSFYIETSDFTSGGGNNFTEFRLIQTKGTGSSVISRRIRVKADGDIVFLDQAHYTGQADLLTIKANGDIICGSSALATNATTGFLRIPTCAGTPSGAAPDGSLVIDSTNHKLYFRSGATWRDAGP